jgi:hypothetical protein
MFRKSLKITRELKKLIQIYSNTKSAAVRVVVIKPVKIAKTSPLRAMLFPVKVKLAKLTLVP